MPGKGEGHAIRAMKSAAGVVAAITARMGLQAGWKVATGEQPPAGPNDSQVPLGQALAWAVLFGGTISAARMIAGRWVSHLVSPRQQHAAGQAGGQGQPPPEPPRSGYLALVAFLVWQRRR
jgi:hypothetical protein